MDDGVVEYTRHCCQEITYNPVPVVFLCLEESIILLQLPH